MIPALALLATLALAGAGAARATDVAQNPAPEPQAGVEERVRELRAAERAARATDADAAAKAADTIARVLADAGRLREACAERERALALYPDAEKARPVLHLGIAELRRALGEPGPCLAQLEALEREIADDPRHARLRPAIESVRAQAYVDLGVPDRASERVLGRWEAARGRAAENPEEHAAALLAYVRLLKAIGDHAGVAALAGAHVSGTDGAELAVLAGTSELMLVADDLAAAERGAARLREALGRGVDASLELYARQALAEWELGSGRPDAAAEHLRRARERGASLDLAELAALDVRVALARGASRAELLELEPRIDAALATLLERWDATPRRAGGIGYLTYADRRGVLGEHVRLAVALHGRDEGARRALESVLRVQARGSLARGAGAAAPDLGTVRAALLPPGRGLLVYVAAAHASHVFALDREGLAYAELSATGVLAPLAARYLTHVTDEYAADELEWASRAERTLAARLSAELLPEEIAGRMAGWDEVSVCGLDTFAWIPFAWLPLGDEPFLGARRAVDHVVSVPFAAERAAAPAPPPALDVVLVGGALAGDDVAARWPELPPVSLDADVEEAVRAGYAPGRARVLRGPAATRAELQALDLASVGVLHFVVHCVVQPGVERPAALLLTAGADDDGLLGCAEVETLSGPRLVALATCRSGAGPTRRGDPGAADLGGAWLTAGARAVLLSHEDLTLGDATGVARALHAELRAGSSPARALQRLRAQRIEVLGGRAPLGSPLLHVVGLGHEAPFPGGRGASAGIPGDAGHARLALGIAAIACAVAAAAIARRWRVRARSPGS